MRICAQVETFPTVRTYEGMTYSQAAVQAVRDEVSPGQCGCWKVKTWAADRSKVTPEWMWTWTVRRQMSTDVSGMGSPSLFTREAPP